MTLLLNLLLLASVAAGNPPRLPWHLNILVERNGQHALLTQSFDTEEECVEGLVLLMFSPPKKGVTLVNATCDREPQMI